MLTEVVISMSPKLEISLDTTIYSTLMDWVGGYFKATQQECRYQIYRGIDEDYYGHLDLISLSKEHFNLFAFYCEKAKKDYFQINVITQRSGDMPRKESIVDYTPEEQRNIRLEALLYAWDDLLELLKQDPRYESDFLAQS